MQPILVTSGEPAGIGPDLCLELASHEAPIVVLGDKYLLQDRARVLGKKIIFVDYDGMSLPIGKNSNQLNIIHLACPKISFAGHLDVLNAPYVINMLTLAADKCLAGEFSALVTAPVNKSIINEAGFYFTGHTEFLATHCRTETVVMMLASSLMKVALVTTHLPLRDVVDAITSNLIIDVVTIINNDFRRYFAIDNPVIYLAGLNPHAGEGGYLGMEEIDIIQPAILELQKRGLQVHGPYPADSMYIQDNREKCDVFVAMYHDQGLPVLKYASFGNAVNITLGLPIIRTSVDHGTALHLAGSGLANDGSMIAAVDMAVNMVRHRQ
jgi:4-hydroxythreonine-4-phosphate dehydrogenase